MYLTKHKMNRPTAFNTFFDDAFIRDFFHQSGSDTPLTNVKETSDQYVIELSVPGWKKEEFSIELKEKMLVVSADHKEEQVKEEEQYTRKEFKRHSFRRSFTLPETVNFADLTASYDSGVLYIHLPKKAEVKQEVIKKIEVR